ncbi:MAG: ABC transporter substrate-binding protein [Gammaproteobacteria bacterium]|nr:ABC transporter substrate-binding protein [Gammaproteobacteria bacterium]
MKNTISVVLLTLSLAVAAPSWASAPPDELVRKTTEEILALTKANREVYTKDLSKLYKMADEKVLPHFDFSRMAQWVLGINWRSATPEQRTRFTSEFRTLLVRTYATALLNYTDQKIIYLPLVSKPGDTDVVVRTEVKQTSGGSNIPIHYTFYKKNDDWKVYDVSIDGVSLVTNYRSVYAGKIKNEGMDALIASVAQSNQPARK